MLMKDIDFLIIGATKSATTWLQRSLQADPLVSMPSPELHYFSREFSKGDDWYLSQFPPRADTLTAGEKSNSYLEDPEAADRIASKLPDVKLVVQLRNPVERAYSDYCMWYRRGEVGRDVESYLDPRSSRNARFVSLGLYGRQLRAYYDRFPSDHILVTFYEAVLTEPEQHLATVRSFLGLPAEQSVSFIPGKVKDKSTPMLRPGLRRLFRPAKSVVAPFRDNPFFRKVHAAFATEIRYSPFPDSVRQRLTDHYAPDVEELGRLIGRDLTAWLHRPAGRRTVASRISSAEVLRET
ncbi:MAG: sulfotransferase domain-containing protein [Mesorhizobium sp.]|nr:MAG: sulfotransferase domain-containing protein [Mesorhizobium sp.]